MSNRSVYPEGVEVHQRHLANTEAQRTEVDKQTLSDTTTRGVLVGLGVTIPAPPNDTKISIAAGAAYAPNGEFLNMAVAQTAVSLADSTLGVKNYVLLVYDETQSSPESHETDGTTRQTIATVAPRLAILTEAQYNALSLDNPVLSANDKNRACIVAIVTANGPGVPLTSGSIQHPTFYRAVLQSNQPAIVTGVVILAIDSSTNTGNGTLAFDFSSVQLTWQAPSEGSPGVPTVITVSGVYIITSSSGKTLVVNVFTSSLPVADVSETLTITNIYSQAIPRFSAEDFQHRTLVGSGVPTPNNPHAMTLDDLSPGAQGTVEEHQDLMHANGILKSSNPATLSATVNSGPAPDTLSVTSFSTNDFAYINGRRINSLTTSSTILFTDVVSNLQALYGIWLGEDGNLFKQIRAQYPVGSLLENKTQIVDVVGFTGGTANLVWNTSNALSFNSGPAVAAPDEDCILRLYGLNRISYVDVWVKSGLVAPGVNETDVITLTALPNLEVTMPVCNVPYSGASTGFLGYGFGPASAPNSVWDKRIFGTLDETNATDYSGISSTVGVVSELLGDGVLARSNVQALSGGDNEVTVLEAQLDQLTLGVLAFPLVTLSGGVVYISGRRFDIPTTTLTMIDNATNKIWVNYDGTVETDASLTWQEMIDSKRGRRVLPLYDEIVVAGVTSVRSDRRVYIGQKRDTALGVLALSKYKRVDVADASGAPAGYAYRFTATGPNNVGAVVGVGFGTGEGLRGENPGTGTGTSGIAVGTGAAGVFGSNFLGLGTAVVGLGSLFASSAAPAGTGVAGVGSAFGASPGGFFEGTGTAPGASFSSASGSRAALIPSNQYYAHSATVSKSIILSGSSFVPISPASHWDRSASGGNGFGIAWRSHDTQIISLQADVHVPALSTVTGLEVLAAQANVFGPDYIGVYFAKNVYNSGGFPTITSIGSGGTGTPTLHLIPMGGVTSVPVWNGPDAGYSYTATQMPAAVVGTSEGHLSLNIRIPATSLGLGAMWFYGVRIRYTMTDFTPAL